MSITWRPATGNFQDQLYKVLEALEGPTQASRWFLQTDVDTPTIGIGFDLLKSAGGVEAKEVLRAMGFDVDGAWPGQAVTAGSAQEKEQKYINQLLGLFASSNKTQATYDAVMASRKAAVAADTAYAAYISNPRATFRLADDTEVRTVFDAVWPSYLSQIQRWFGTSSIATDAGFLNSKELMALACTRYVGTLGPHTIAAIKNGNRALAWYEIRYGWREDSRYNNGWAKRHYFESAMFGLYDDPARQTATLDEAKNTYEMYTANRADILRREAAYGEPPDGTSNPNNRIPQSASDYRAVLNAAGGGDPQSLTAALAPARDAFVDWINSQLPAGEPKLTASEWNPAAIGYSGNTTSLPVVDATALDGKGGDMDKNLLVGNDRDNKLVGGAGNDLLFGAKGHDNLVGGTGDDTLVGGADNDALDGGAGNDTYVFGADEGADTLADADGNGEIHVGGTKLAGADQTHYELVDGVATWKDDNGTVYSFKDTGGTTGTLTISKGGLGGGTITINNFDIAKAQTDGYLGLSLKRDPKVALTTTGQPNPFETQGGSANSVATNMQEKGGKSLTIYLSEAARAGDTLTVSVTDGMASLLKLVTGADTLDLSQPVTLTLQAGQTELTFAIINDQAFDDDQDIQLQADWNQGDQVAQSNTASLTLKDDGQAGRTYIGDQRAPIIGVEVDPGGSPFNAYKWSVTTWGTDGTLIGGVAQAGFNDVIYGQAANDKISGMGGNDALDGGAGSDEIDGGDGDDLIGGGAGSDVILGGAGNDVILSATGLDVYQRYSVDDQWSAPAGTTAWISGSNWGVYTDGEGKTIVGGGSLTMDSAGDSIDAGDGDDVVIGGNGDDHALGGKGDDELWGNAGNDALEGGDGDDYLVGDGIKDPGYYQTLSPDQHGNDFLDGGAGDDTVVGDGGDDVLYGGSGADIVWGDDTSEDKLEGRYHGNDYLDGEDGDDQLVGGGKDDTLYGGAGNDRLWGDGDSKDMLAGESHGNDYLDGEDGDDYMVGGGKDDTLFGGAGNDTMSGDDRISQLDGTFHGADYLDGGDGNDQMLGGGGADTLIGGAGDDLMFGDDQSEQDLPGDLHGDDYLDGGDGADQLIGGGASDTLLGGEGNDSLWGDNEQSKLAGNYHGNDYLDGGAGDDFLIGGGGSDVLVGGDGNDELQGDATDQLVSGAFQGNDYLDGGDGDDRLFGQGGDDTLIGGAGADYLNGDGQTSETDASVHGNDVLDGGDGNDTLLGGGGNDFLSGGAGDDFLSGEDQTNSATLSQLTGDDTLSGGDGNDILLGGNGNNELSGDDGNDTLWGGNGDDLLDGGAGNDLLRSGAGNDTLMGGAGNDIYYVALGSGEKHIQDGGGDGEFNILVLEGGFNLGMVQLTLGSLVIGDASGTTQIHLDDVDYDDLVGSSPIQQVQFSDGSSMSIAQLLDAVPITIPATEQADFLQGTSGSEVIHALAGDDIVAGKGGNDLLDLGAGNDMAYGGDGNDTLLGGNGDDVLQGDAGIDQLDGGAGADQLLGGDGNDILTGADGNDTLFGDAGGDQLDGGLGDDQLAGGDGDDLLAGADGNDTLSGDAGADRLDGGTGADQLAGGAGNDTLLGAAGNDSLDGGDADDQLSGGDGLDSLAGGSGNDTLDGGSDADILVGGSGNDVFFVDDAGDQVVEAAGDGTDTIHGTISLSLVANVEGLVLDESANAVDGTGNGLDNTITGNANANTLRGLDGADTLSGGAGNDTLDGGAGADALVGGTGDDVYFVDDVGDTITEAWAEGQDSVVASVDFALSDNVEALTLTGTAQTGTGNALANTLVGNAADNVLDGQAGNDLLQGGAGDDHLIGGSGADTLAGGQGDDIYDVDDTGDLVVELAGEGSDTVRSSVDYTLGANLENLVLTGDGNVDATGNALDNQLTGNSGANVLDGGAGTDTLAGGDGDDTYVLDSAADVVVELADGGNDTVVVGFSYTVGSDIENVRLTGTADLDATGDAGDNVLEGNAGDNRLDGGGGSDVLTGGDGNDTYIVDSEDDAIYEAAGAGIDTVVRSYDTLYILNDNVEDLTLVGAAQRGNGNDLDNLIVGNDNDNNLLGLDGNDTLIGGAGDDALFGSEGADSLVGGTGDDYYEVDDVGDTLVENANEGDDFIQASISWTLGANFERLALTGTDALTATGNELANGLWGNAGDNTLTGGLGNDYLFGDAGDDVYVFNKGDGQDSIDNTDALGATDVLSFGAGISDNDVLAFQSGSNLFFKVKGTTDQIGFIGYYAANTTSNGVVQDHKIDAIQFANGVTWDQAMIQTVVDRANNNHAPTVATFLPTLSAKAGTPFSYAVPVNTITDPDSWDSITYSISMSNGSAVPSWVTFDATTRTISAAPTAANVGSLQFVLWGTDNYGSAAGEFVTLNVGPANRAPVVASALADKTAALGAPLSITLPAGSFTDTDGDALAYAATLADGSALPAWLSFNAGTRTFTGTPGTAGTVSVKVTATDTSNASASDVFDIAVSLQNLVLTGTANADTLVGGSGNDSISGAAGNDTLVGNAGNDTLNGGAGNDSMTGGTGDDTYFVDSATDVVVEAAGEGTDNVQSGVTWTLGNNVENLTLTGTSAINGTGNALDNALTGNGVNNVLTGGAGNDTLDGGAGYDTMAGGLGDDTYFVNVVTDVVTENAGEGIDTVNSAVTWTLGSTLENLTLTGTSAINGTGNALDNVLVGNSVANTLTGGAGNDTLDGGLGSDTMVGGTGNDTYVVNVSTDVVTENAGEGTDTVQSAVTWTLGTTLENLTLTGTSALNGTGNASDNVLTGNGAANVLAGLAGNDTYAGGQGNDTLTDTSTTSNDLYIWGRGEGVDTLADSGGTDRLQVEVGVTDDQLWFRHVGNNLEVSVIGTSDQFVINGWYSSAANQVESIVLSDGKTLLASDVHNLVDAMASFSAPAAGQITLPSNYQSALVPVIVANWH